MIFDITLRANFEVKTTLESIAASVPSILKFAPPPISNACEFQNRDTRPELQKALWIDVGLYADRTAQFRAFRQHRPDEALYIGTPLAMDEQAVAVSSADQGQRRF